MLQASSAAFTPRPRPPRSRSTQLSSSTSLAHVLESPAATSVEEEAAARIESHNWTQDGKYTPLPLMLAGLETPPYTPPLPSLDMDNENAGSKGGGHGGQAIGTAEQLEAMLEEARRTIRDRERGLSCTCPRRLFYPILTSDHLVPRPRHSSFDRKVVAGKQQRSAREARCTSVPSLFPHENNCSLGGTVGGGLSSTRNSAVWCKRRICRGSPSSKPTLSCWHISSQYLRINRCELWCLDKQWGGKAKYIRLSVTC